MSKRVGETPSSERGVFQDYIPPIITHVLLVVGILFFNWSVIELLFLYLIEVAVIHVLFVTAALFAAQPIADHDADKWQREPDPIQLVSVLPPVYRRNTGLVRKYMFFGFIYILPFFYAISDFAEQSLSSLLSPTISFAVLAICVSQVARAWRQFFANQSYRERSPAEAIKVGLWPVHELVVILLFVFVPITVIVVAASFAVGDIESGSIVLLAYVIPIGIARTWLQNGALTVRLQYEK